MATHVTGAPWLDGDRQRRLAGAAIRREILVALSGPGHSVSLPEHLSCLDRLAEAAKKLPDVTWRIRLHSKDDPTFYRPRFPDRVIFNLPSKDRLPIDADLESAGILITAGSTSGIDALRMGVPVVTVEGPPTFVVPPYVKAGTTTHVGRGQDLTEALRALLANSARADVQERAERWVAHFYGPADGHAADRIAQVIRPLFVS